MTRILAVATVSPKHRYTTEEVIKAAETFWLTTAEDRVKELAVKLLRGAEIRHRFSVIPIEEVFSEKSFAEKNDIYMEATKALAESALRNGLERAGVAPAELDFLITTSCTGFMIPSVDAYLVDKIGLRQDVVRLPVTEMGCAGGTSALIYANEILKGNPGKRIAIVAVETPSVTFQRADFSPENLVSTAIFADGAACVILGPGGSGPEIVDTNMYHFPNSTHLMGYRLTNSGLKIVLDRDVPDAIAAQFESYFMPLLKRHALAPGDIRHYVFHPGGKKIINQVEKMLAPFNRNVDAAKEVLSERGNMSSATVLHVLDEVIRNARPAAGDYGLMLAFGPGFSAQSLLLQWKESTGGERG